MYSEHTLNSEHYGKYRQASPGPSNMSDVMYIFVNINMYTLCANKNKSDTFVQFYRPKH